MQYRRNRIPLTPHSEQLMVAKVLRHELLHYISTREHPCNWTPSGMLEAASKFTGVAYRGGQYRLAAQDLTILIMMVQQ